VDRIRIGDRPATEREIVEHRGSVVIVPVTERDTVLLVRQWRHAIGKALLEAPAGTRDVEGESPEDTAMRELREETGHSARKLTPLQGFWVAPGWCNEYMYAYLATGLNLEPLPQDGDEDVHVAETPLGSVLELIRSGEIQDAKSIVSLLCAIHLTGR
jgi:ADP-ribose pyrophosphatase